MKSFKEVFQELLSENKVYKKGDTVSLLSFDRKQTGKAKVKSVMKAKPNKFGIKNYYVTDKGIFSNMEVDGTSAYKLRFKGNTEKEVMKALGEKAPNTDDAMKRYKAGKAGFTDIAHLKAKGLIARADGTKRKSPKYESVEQIEEQISSVVQIQDRVDMYITKRDFAMKLADTLQKARYNVTLEPLSVGFRVTVHFNPSSYKSKPYDKQLKDLLNKAKFKGKPEKEFRFGKLPYSMNESYDLFEELKQVGISEKQIKGLKNKADKTGIPYGILKQVYDRGMAAWKTGHRPGAGQHQWAFARVNSFATKSKGTWGGADKDLADKVRAGKKR